MKKITNRYQFVNNIKNKEFILQKEQQYEQSSYVPSKASSKIISVKYDFEYNKNTNSNSHLPTILISIKDNLELLSCTIDNIYENGVNNHANIMVIEDRKESDKILDYCKDNQLSHISIKNDKDIFNFSMLHNIAANFIFEDEEQENKDIVLWSSDLWVDDINIFPKLYNKHKKDKSTISGTKLLYPTSKFKFKKDERQGLVQYGGSHFTFRSNNYGLFPFHIYRGVLPEDPRVNCDKGEDFITGAFMIFDLYWFVRSGGFNPSMRASFQDTDLCLRAVSENKKIMYYGKDLQLYHYENFTLYEPKMKEKLKKFWQSDKIVYVHEWSAEHIKSLLFPYEK